MGEPVEGLEGFQSPVLKSTLDFRGVKFGVPQVMVVFGYGNGFGGACLDGSLYCGLRHLRRW